MFRDLLGSFMRTILFYCFYFLLYMIVLCLCCLSGVIKNNNNIREFVSGFTVHTPLKRSRMARVSQPNTSHTYLYSPATEHHRLLAATHCVYPRRDGQAELHTETFSAPVLTV